MANIVFSSAAFWGDVMPYVPIANELVERGHDVTYSLPAVHHEVLAHESFGLHDNRSTFSHYDVLSDPAQLEMLDKQQGSTTGTAMVRYWAKRYFADEADQWVDATAEALRGADLIVVHPTAATLSAIPAQAAQIPWVVGHLFPSMIRSRHTDPAGVDLSRLPAPVARTLRRVAWKTAPTLASPIMQDKAINRVRARYDLPPKRGNLMVAWMDADATAVLASPLYAPPRPDWPDRVTSTGFTPWAGPTGFELDPAIESYLSEGDPPVLVTMGTSTATIAGPILRATAAALDQLGHRGLFLVGTDENRHALDGVDGVFRFAPLGQVLDRCQAVVHQGGHGTVTATIHAGLPSVALPMGFDQIAHGRRLTQLGIGTMVKPRDRGTDSIAAAIASVLDDDVRHRARAFAADLQSENGTASTCDLIESTLDHAA
jgi:UDP:flavonoid glycosyltransferase YjiC (YdhE family)